MAFAYQYITRPGNGYGGYVVNDGTHSVFIPSTSESDRVRLHKWIGNGDIGKGRDMVNSALAMPTVTLNPAQYNALVITFNDYTKTSFVKGN